MNLDDFKTFADLDPQDMYSHIDRLPEQLLSAWSLGGRQPLPIWASGSHSGSIRQAVIAGMGGSAIGGDLVTAFLEPLLKVPVVVHRDYGLPGWAFGPETLVIASSHSGNTEETLDSFHQALERQCKCLMICTGGKLAQAASETGVPAWIFEHKGQPRSAVGFSFGLLLSVFHRLKLIVETGTLEAEVAEAVTEMRTQQTMLRKEVDVVHNPAKRMAGQLMERMVSVFGAGLLAPVARRWKGQISEIAKAWAQFEFIPEADHNTLAGTVYPQEVIDRMMVLFLSSPSDQPRNALRLELTRQSLMVDGFNTDFIKAGGKSRLADQWTLLHFGDYMSYYLAMAYQVDPTPVTALQNFKARLDGYK